MVGLRDLAGGVPYYDRQSNTLKTLAIGSYNAASVKRTTRAVSDKQGISSNDVGISLSQARLPCTLPLSKHCARGIEDNAKTSARGFLVLITVLLKLFTFAQAPISKPYHDHLNCE